MKNLKVLIVLLALIVNLQAQEKPLNIIVFGAHPDDAEIDAGGTAIKYSQLGHNVLFVSLTNGDAGHLNKGGGALAKIRMAEAQEAGKRLGVTYKVLDHHDTELMPTLELRLEIIRLIRQWNADIVITHRPYDYHPDHRNTAIAVQDAAFLVIVPNVAPDVPALRKNPVFLYSYDSFQKPIPFNPYITIDISDVYDKKIYGIAAHKSQSLEFLPWLAGKLDQVPNTEKEQLEWIALQRTREITSTARGSLVKWYGKEKAAKVTDAESFEICEFGRHPSDDEIRKLFPMIGN